MKVRPLTVLLVCVSLLLLVLTPSFAKAKRPVVRIGTVKDGPTVRFHDGMNILKEEIFTLMEDEYDVHFLAENMVEADWTIEGIKKAVDGLLDDRKVDLVIALGYGASNYLAKKKNFPKPVIATLVVNGRTQGFPEDNGASGVHNFTYISPLTDPVRNLETFKELVPFQNIAFLVDRNFMQTFPKSEPFRKQVKALASSFDMSVNIVFADSTAEEALNALPAETDAVFVFPLIRFSEKEFEKLAGGLIRAKLPSYSVVGRDEVESGLLVSTRAKSNIGRIARRIALNVQRIFSGENAATLKVAFPIDWELTINMATARAIGVYPSWSILTEATLIQEESKIFSRSLSLDSAVEEAIEANLNLAIQEKNVAAGRRAVEQARARLFPQIDLDASGVIIDDDRAIAGQGVSPEKTLSGSASATQLIYDDDTWTSFKVEKDLQVTREEQRETVRLDIALDAAVAYLDVLRAKTLERIEKDNLKLTRANLDRARARVSAGVANRSEEFRWESEIASSRQEVLKAQAARWQAEKALNQLLHRPLEEQFATEETALENPFLLVSDKRYEGYVSNPMKFLVFRDFYVKEGLALAPEIRFLNAAIAAQEKILANSKRAFWLPTFSVKGSVTELIDDSGEGTRDQSATGLNDTDWSVGIFANFPLVQGGGKFATTKRAIEELKRLKLQKDATAERIEQRIRSAMHEAGASYPSIALSRQAAEASMKNLELITDSYVRGVVSIIDLLDAQTAALVSAQTAENAVFDFLIDWMVAQRAAGHFDIFFSADQREDWFQNLDAYYDIAGVAPRR